MSVIRHPLAHAEALAPTEEVMHSVLNDPDLLGGFDDPDVMAAVTDIAVDPRRAVKYQDNPKVMCL